MDRKIKVEVLLLNDEADLNKKIIDYKAKGYQYLDLFDIQVEELTELTCLGDENKISETIYEYKKKQLGNLVIFPWRKSVIRILCEEDYLKLLTSRNKYLINDSEQRLYWEVNLSIAGLSVGSNVALAIVMQGGCKNIRIADPDEISTSNMNRILTGLFSIGEKKTTSLAKRLYEINPYVSIQVFSEGITGKNLQSFCRGADIVFDEIDNLGLKLDLRLEAKRKCIPLIMITDNGDNVMVDIERYDLNASLKPFHDLLSDDDLTLIQEHHSKLSPRERVILSLKIVQPQNVVPRMLDSLLEVGKTIKTWPQLSTASLLAGNVGSYIVRNIAIGNPLRQGRLHVSVDNALVPDLDSPEKNAERAKHLSIFLSKLDN